MPSRKMNGEPLLPIKFYGRYLFYCHRNKRKGVFADRAGFNDSTFIEASEAPAAVVAYL